MNQAIRNTWVVIIAMFMVLIVAISIIQVVAADALKNNDFNSRQLYQEFGSARGPILVDGNPIAESVESNDDFNYQRVYHDTHLYSGLTGFYSLTFGATGLEDKLNRSLAGSSDGQFVDRLIQLFSGTQMEGAQVELTIDPTMQELAYSVLPDGVQASAVITDPSTGEILAMASKPSYDTNLLATHSGAAAAANMEELQAVPGLSPYVNRPTASLPAPGSTFKLIDTVAMLESGDYQPDQVLDVPDSITLPNSSTQLGNFGGGLCGNMNRASLAEIFAQSCNTPFATAAMELGQDRIRQTAENFGFNQSFEIPLSVTASQFPSDLDDAALAQSSIGQRDVKATALQMNMVAAAIANDGTLMKPQLIDTIRGSDLTLLEDVQPEVFKRSTTPEIAEQMTELMRGPLDGGTAYRAKSATVDIAAKTGTAQLGADNDLVNSWITGFAPADDPQVAVTIVYQNIDFDQGSALTSTNLKEIMEAVVTQ
ncbi:penicillin-binding transpeptidase domain-containing protein [Microbacterium sp. A93]|uniref:penicillin-binding transpeptidase domain-containing protein n=1 Tax=Microbacterium sp. A93 TaxID=3450716 RepID=UPI003F423A81